MSKDKQINFFYTIIFQAAFIDFYYQNISYLYYFLVHLAKIQYISCMKKIDR